MCLIIAHVKHFICNDYLSTIAHYTYFHLYLFYPYMVDLMRRLLETPLINTSYEAAVVQRLSTSVLTVRIHVVVLVRLNELDAVRLCVTSGSSSMVNVHVTRNSWKWSDMMRRCSRMPFTAADDWRTSGCRVRSRTSVVRIRNLNYTFEITLKNFRTQTE